MLNLANFLPLAIPGITPFLDPSKAPQPVVNTSLGINVDSGSGLTPPGTNAADLLRTANENQENEMKIKNAQNSGKSTLLGTGIGNSSINLQ